MANHKLNRDIDCSFDFVFMANHKLNGDTDCTYDFDERDYDDYTIAKIHFSASSFIVIAIPAGALKFLIQAIK